MESIYSSSTHPDHDMPCSRNSVYVSQRRSMGLICLHITRMFSTASRSSRRPRSQTCVVTSHFKTCYCGTRTSEQGWQRLNGWRRDVRWHSGSDGVRWSDQGPTSEACHAALPHAPGTKAAAHPRWHRRPRTRRAHFATHPVYVSGLVGFWWRSLSDLGAAACGEAELTK
jgi:hypothetical protein